MKQKIRILHLEDIPTDAELVERELKKGKINFEKLVVSNKADFSKALEEFTPDIILSDHSLPSFDSLQALKMLKEREVMIPFILITSTMTEEFAVTVLKEGMSDYILKDRLQRLPSAILNTLEKYRLEVEKQKFMDLITSNEKRFRALIEKSPDMKTISTEDGKMLYCSPSIEKGLGYTPDEFMLKTAKDLIHPDDLQIFMEQRNGILQTYGKFFNHEHRVKHKDGHWVWVESTMTNMLHEPGVYAFVSNFMDISERKAAEQQRRFDNNNLNALINNTADLMWSVDRDFNLITSNEPFDEMAKVNFGYIVPKGGNILSTANSSEMLAHFKQLYERAFAGEAFTETAYFDHPVEFWSEISYYPIRKGEEIIGTACHSRDITSKKITERNLLQSETKLKEAQAIAQVGNWEIDIVQNRHNWSDEMYRILGAGKNEEASTELFVSFIHPDDLDNANGKINDAFQTLKNSFFDFRFIRRDGIIRYGYSEWSFQFDKSGNPLRLFGIIQDVTERKLAEVERTKITNDLLQRNKDLEQFAYIISHNLRSPVANIIGISNAMEDTLLSEADKDMLNRALSESVLRLDDVVKDLNHILQVKREITEIREKVRFSELVNDIKISIKNLIDMNNVEIKYDFSSVDEFLTLKSYMYSIFYNLISNSIKYRQPEAPCLIEVTGQKTGDKTTLTFRDNSMGIDLQKKGEQVFGLYKRFHTNIEGKGMGLFMVKTQVETLGGRINIQSGVNKGTEFTIEFEK